MFLFLKLYWAHLIADFVLQFDELYRLKVKSRLGHFIHVLIHFILSALVVIPYWSFLSVWCFLAALSLLHYLQDTVKYEIQKSQSKMFYAFVSDQIVHALLISGILFLGVSRLPLGFPDHPFLNALYLDPFWTLLAVAWTWSTFGVSYLLFTFRQSYIKNSRPDQAITTPEMSFALMERTVITLSCLLAFPWWWAGLSLLVFIPRILTKKFADPLDMGFSLLCSVFIGFLFRWWI